MVRAAWGRTACSAPTAWSPSGPGEPAQADPRRRHPLPHPTPHPVLYVQRDDRPHPSPRPTGRPARAGQPGWDQYPETRISSVREHRDEMPKGSRCSPWARPTTAGARTNRRTRSGMASRWRTARAGCGRRRTSRRRSPRNAPRLRSRAPALMGWRLGPSHVGHWRTHRPTSPPTPKAWEQVQTHEEGDLEPIVTLRHVRLSRGRATIGR